MFPVRFGLRPAIAVLACCSIFYAVGLWQTSLLGGRFTPLSPLGFNRLPCPPELNPNASADDVVVVKNAIFHGENENENENDPISSTRSENLKLDFELHHQTERVPLEAFSNTSENDDMPPFELCDMRYSEHTPCEDPANSRRFTSRMMISRERHCPGAEQRELLRCLVPAPLGYRAPFPWPKSREHAWYANVPHKRLAVAKADQNWIRFEKDRFFFPGGGTSFPSGARKYIESLAKLVPLSDGSIRTALDTGCGVASWGAYLFNYKILTMSIAPIDIHEAQVQFALERGVPAMIGVLGTRRLPYPARSFDMAHCSRCLIPWTDNDGLYLIEIDRVLRPGGYWVLSGPPINWKKRHTGWNRTVEDLLQEQNSIEDLARHLCWKKIAEKDDIAVWRKATNHIHCIKNRRLFKYPSICQEGNEDVAWYKNMETCITPLPPAKDIKDVAGMALEKWPERVSAVPPRIIRNTIPEVTVESYMQDTDLWNKRVSYYGRFVDRLTQGKFRNIMDMNSGLGSFAAALSQYPVWVMNVVPEHLKNNTLGVIYERGFIGTYMDWCEAFSTYPRTYDLVHAANIFTMYQDRCDMRDILLEMDRIVRPTGAVIIYDHVDVLVKVKKITDRMGWQGQLAHSERGPFDEEKLLFFNNTSHSGLGVVSL